MAPRQGHPGLTTPVTAAREDQHRRRAPLPTGAALAMALALGACGFDLPWRAPPPDPALTELPLQDGDLMLDLGPRRLHARRIPAGGPTRLWRTADNVVIAMAGPRIVATAGLPQMLTATRFDGPDPLATPLALTEAAVPARRVIDLMRADRDPAGMRFGVALDCRLRAEPAEGDVTLIEERCRSPDPLPILNRFWIDADTGALLRSDQWIGPGLPTLRIEAFSRPPPRAPAPAPSDLLPAPPPTEPPPTEPPPVAPS